MILESGEQIIGRACQKVRRFNVEFEIARFIDHTLLRPEATSQDIIRLCKEALKYQFAAVCVNPCYAALAAKILKNSRVKVASVAGFPLGANLTDVKVLEAKRAVEDGASEIDMVMNIGALKNREYQKVREDVTAVVEAVKPAPVKVIVETVLLNSQEKEKICQIIEDSEAAFIKTSTGFIQGGKANREDITLFKKILKKNTKIKASGGIRDLSWAQTLIDCGASRIGTSSGLKIIAEEIEKYRNQE